MADLPAADVWNSNEAKEPAIGRTVLPRTRVTVPSISLLSEYQAGGGKCATGLYVANCLVMSELYGMEGVRGLDMQKFAVRLGIGAGLPVLWSASENLV